MKNITITLDDKLASTARVEAARQGKSLSRFVSELVEERVRPKPGSQREALEIFLSGPPLNLTDENGNAPSRDQIYDR